MSWVMNLGSSSKFSLCSIAWLQGLSDMWMWINIITNKKAGKGLSLSRMAPASHSWDQSSYAESDYSLPQSPASTRPPSQASCYTSSCPTTPLSSRRQQFMMSPYRSAIFNLVFSSKLTIVNVDQWFFLHNLPKF